MKNRKRLKEFKDFFLGKSIEQCSLIVLERNRYNLKAYSILGMIMMSFGITFGWIMREVFTFNIELHILWSYFFIMYIINRFIAVSIKHITIAFYLWIIPVMMMGIIMGTFGDPTEPSITIMVFLCVIPMFILDKPWRVTLFICINAIVYTICCYCSKTLELFVADMIDLILFSVLSIGINCLILRDRITNVENAMNMMLIADTDYLTQINNRGAGIERVEFLLKENKGGMFLLIDLDNFKEINDTYGHIGGDKALIGLASCLKQTFRDSDVVMRFGGDEFAVFAHHIENDQDRLICIERMMQEIRNISIPELPDCQLSVSVGISLISSNVSKDYEQLYLESDQALYVTKRLGKNSYSFFNACE